MLFKGILVENDLRNKFISEDNSKPSESSQILDKMMPFINLKKMKEKVLNILFWVITNKPQTIHT